MPRDHPEIQLGIPPRVVVAKGANKALVAASCFYEGPLTIGEFVEAGQLDSNNAIAMITNWVRDGGTFEQAQEMCPGFKMPEQEGLRYE